MKASHRHPRAFTLIELLLALSLMALLMGGAYEILAVARRTQNRAQVSARLNQVGRACLDRIRRDFEGLVQTPGPFNDGLWAEDGHSTCALQYDSRLPRPGMPATTDEIHADYLRWLNARSNEVVRSTEIALPAGPALRTDWVSDRGEGQVRSSTYEFQVGDAHMRLICRAQDPPEDRWLSLAEAIRPRG